MNHNKRSLPQPMSWITIAIAKQQQEAAQRRTITNCWSGLLLQLASVEGTTRVRHTHLAVSFHRPLTSSCSISSSRQLLCSFSCSCSCSSHYCCFILSPFGTVIGINGAEGMGETATTMRRRKKERPAAAATMGDIRNWQSVQRQHYCLLKLQQP